MIIHKPFPMLCSQKISGTLVRQGASATSVIRCCALPNDKPKKKDSSPTSQVFNITGGEVQIHIHMGDARGQAAKWDAVTMSPEAKALLQKHAVKASTALKMHNILGFEDVGDLQHLSSDLIAQLKLKPLQLEPLAKMLHDLQNQQDVSLIVGMPPAHQDQRQEQQQQQQQQQDGSKQPEDYYQAQDQQQHTGQMQVAGHTDVPPSPDALPTADASSLPAVSPAADDLPTSTDHHGKTGQAAAGVAAEGEMPPAAPASRAGAHAEPGTGGHTQARGGLHKHACVAIMTIQGKAGGEGAVVCVAITPDGRRAVTAGPGHELHVWDLEARSWIAALEGHTADVLAVAITPDGRRAVSSSEDDTLRVWDLDSYACTATMGIDSDHSDGWVESVAITPDGQHALFAAGSELFKWAMDDSEAWALDGFDSWGSVSSIVVSPDGRLAVTGGCKEELRVWDLDGDRLVGTLEGHTDWATSVAITPDGRHAVSASDGETDPLRVWDLATRTCIGTMEGHGSSVSCVATTPDGRRVVSGSVDTKLRVWDLATRTRTGVMKGHGSEVSCVAISSDGRYAVSASYDGDLLMWDLDPASSPHS